MLLGTAKMSAQFYNPYCNPYMYEAQAEAQLRFMENQQLAQMRAQTMAIHMEYMQMLQANTAAAYNNVINFQWTPAFPTVSFDNEESQIRTSEKVSCSTCGGTGRVTREKASYSQRRMVTVR